MKTIRRTSLVLGVISLMAFSSCEKELLSEETIEGEPNSSLTIMTRAGSSEGTVSYPVTIYVIDGSGTCTNKEVLTSADKPLALDLTAGTYAVYAIAGATETDYLLPSMENATATSEIKLARSAEHADLMSAKNSIVLEDEEDGMLTLTLNRKVLKMNAITLKNIPESVDAITVTVQQMYQSLLLNGEYGTQEGVESLTLSKEEGTSTWSLPSPSYLFPAHGEATITVKMTSSGETKSVSYTCPEALDANHEVSIEGSYDSHTPQLLTLQGTILGAVWGTPVSIKFTFDDNGAQTAESETGGGNDPVTTEAAPAVNTLYKDCYVLDSKDDDTGSNTVITLLHFNEVNITSAGKEESAVLAEIDAALQSGAFDVEGLSGWRLPTEDEVMKYLPYRINAVATSWSKELVLNDWYFYMSGSQLKTALADNNNVKAGRVYSNNGRLRPVTTVTFGR